ncbi:hypothetical protein DM01DRAFT_1345196 [Hesseltinella vesiculosa]|uniref:Exportin-4 n=1 Tax=Hesseltinella vesiculosa TaxID=101127 RepID=A0A1X2GKC7_9FUNG|nr:hypothetical protein DM01DRAFT_1345196 [Hesseltinella vesiculosa]
MESEQVDVAKIASQFIEACNDFQVPATRAAAEQILTSFRQIPKVLPIAKYILDHATEPMVQFQISLAIGQVAVRDYTLYAVDDLLQLKNYLIDYSLHHEKMPKYARDTLLSAVSLITKRSLSDVTPENRQAILSQLKQLLNANESNAASKLTGASLCNALVDQFSSTRASTVGLNWEFHHNARLFFEVDVLLALFQETITQLHTIIAANPTPSSTNASASPLLTELLTLTEKILTWEFETVKNQPCLPGTFGSSTNDDLDDQSPSSDRASYNVYPSSWKSVLGNQDVLWLFFVVYDVVQDHTVLGHRCLQCLIRLAGLQEDFFEHDQQAVQRYATTMMHGIVKMMHRGSPLPFPASLPSLAQRGTSPDELTNQGSQLLGTIQIVHFLLKNISIANFCATDEFFPFLQELQQLTVCCLQAAASDMSEDWITESCDECLRTWVVIADVIQPEDPRDLSARKGLSDGHLNQLNEIMKSVAYRVVEAYMQSQLERAKLVMQDDEEEDEIELGMKDWDTYEDQLTCIAILGRLHPQQCLTHLHQLLVDRLQRFHAFLAGSASDQGVMSGFFLADPGFGEQPLIPDAILQLSSSQPSDQDVVVHLCNQFLELLRVYSCFGPNSVEAANCSPRVAETLIWFMERWCKSFLLLNENDYGMVSANIARAYGRPGPSDGQGLNVLDFLLQQLKANFMLWNADPDVLSQLIRWLDTCGTSVNLKTSLVQSCKWPVRFLYEYAFPELIKFLTSNVGQLPESEHNYLIQTITVISSSVQDPGLRQQYLELIFNVVEEMLSSVLHRADFTQRFESLECLNPVLNALDVFDGIALAMDAYNTAPLFSFLSRFFDSFHKLFEIYKSSAEVHLLILRLLADLLNRVDMSHLSEEQKQGLYQFTMEIIRLYGSYNVGKKRIHSQEEEAERPYDDVCTVLNLLTNMMASDFEGQRRDTNAADVALFGIHTVIPMIDLEMLQYITLVSHLIVRFPDKLPTLPTTLMENLMSSLDYGIRHAVQEINMLTLHAVVPLAHWVLQHPGQAHVNLLRTCMERFLGELLNVLLFQHLESAIIYLASDALLGLVLVSPETYLKMVQQIIAQQPMALQSRLIHAFEKLDQATPKGAVVPSKDQSNLFRQHLSSLLVDVRAVLRVK